MGSSPPVYNSFTVRQTVRGFFALLLPYALVALYRKIPGPLRGRVWGGPSTSGKALADMKAGMNGWRAIHKWARLTW